MSAFFGPWLLFLCSCSRVYAEEQLKRQEYARDSPKDTRHADRLRDKQADRQTRTHIRTNAHAHPHSHTYTRMRARAHTHTHTHTHKHTHAHTYTYKHAHAYGCIGQNKIRAGKNHSLLLEVNSFRHLKMVFPELLGHGVFALSIGAWR